MPQETPAAAKIQVRQEHELFLEEIQRKEIGPHANMH